ncbi:MAG: PAS domain S-box protein, partial [Cyanothece sp. SIO2G6]|nr:PAS domain S-box protein [Cyanothece sp. SIO2G6]
DPDGSAIAVAEAMGHSSASLLGQRIDTASLSLQQHELDPVDPMDPQTYTTQFSDYYPDPLVHLQSQDKLLVPLFCGDNLWGLLQVNGRYDHNRWHHKDIELLQFLSMQLAIALQNATTHQTLQTELVERRQAQLQQQKTAKALQQLNQTLEAKIVERTLALQERESRYRALVDVIPDLMIRIHADGTYLDVVQGQETQGQETQPLKPSQLRSGVNIYAVLPADHAQTRMAYVHKALATKTVQFYEYERVIEGQTLVEEARIVAINACEALVIVRDITERKRTENQLRESEQRFRQAIANAPFPTMIHAEDGEVLQINEVWTEITGYAGSDIPTVKDWAERAYGDRAAAILETIIRPKYSMEVRHDEGELTITTHDGTKRIWHFSSTPLGQ